MVRILDIQLSAGRFVLRVLAAFILAGLTLFVFYYLPLHIDIIASYFVPSAFIPEINSLASAFASSTLPELGVLLAILAFVETLLKGTWAYGVLLIIMGSFWIVYDLTLYREGVLFSNLYPSTITLGNGEQLVLPSSVQSELVLVFTGVIILFVISSLVTIIRGAIILWRKRRSSSSFSSSQPEITEQPIS